MIASRGVKRENPGITPRYLIAFGPEPRSGRRCERVRARRRANRTRSAVPTGGRTDIKEDLDKMLFSLCPSPACHFASRRPLACFVSRDSMRLFTRTHIIREETQQSINPLERVQRGPRGGEQARDNEIFMNERALLNRACGSVARPLFFLLGRARTW